MTRGIYWTSWPVKSANDLLLSNRKPSVVTCQESLPRTLLKIEEKDQHKDIGTQAKISSAETGTQAETLTAETGTQAEIFRRHQTTQTEEGESYPLKYPGDDKWGPILVTLTEPHISFRKRRQGK
ncbi:hypothetical protein PUN28_008230 [Cardiocondyla obscurior]|uniref:Uncharacterized protein n=1 Tax=Cardiocondyla obscurior TaxID=286306 RepID=A0AAW2G2P7_9HYME